MTVQAIWDRRSQATYIVSNLCFEPSTIASWVKRVRRCGRPLPIQLGIVGPGHTPQRLRTRVAKENCGSESILAGLRVFTVNQVVETEAWRRFRNDFRNDFR